MKTIGNKRKMKRKCLVCGREINLILHSSKYNNGHYFGKFKLPIKPGEYKKVGTVKLGRIKADVVKWTGKEKEVEYWECNKCFDGASHKCWLEGKIEKLFGEKCKEYEPHCPTCEAWSLYNTIIKDTREKL